MNGAALTYAAVAVHQAELRAAAERSRRGTGRSPRKRRLALPRPRRARRAYA